MEVTVLTYSGEEFYSDKYSHWQGRLGHDFAKKYYRDVMSNTDEESVYFKDDKQAEEFWDNLYQEQFKQQRVQVEPGTLVKDLIHQLVKPYTTDERSFIPLVNYRLILIPTGQPLQPNQTLLSAGVVDGDMLGLMLAYKPLGQYSMIRIPSSSALFDTVQSADEKPPRYINPYDIEDQKWRQPEDSCSLSRIWGALLYTDEDTELATYVRKYFGSLNELSDDIFHVFVIEKPDWRLASKYWKSLLQDKRYVTWKTMKWLSSKPYDKNQAYEIADKLGLYRDQLPCLVLFDTLERDKKLVFPISDTSPNYFTKYFRSFFSTLKRISSASNVSDTPYEAIMKRYDDIMQTLARLRPIFSSPDKSEYSLDGNIVFINHPEGPVRLSDFQKKQHDSDSFMEGSMSEQYIFNSPTTYINRPRDTVIKDFQNNYITGDGSGRDKVNIELKELVDLILRSKKIPDGTKGETVQAVHLVAEQIKEQKANKLTLKGTLQAVQEVVSKAADIAGPAISIISTVFKLLGLA